MSGMEKKRYKDMTPEELAEFKAEKERLAEAARQEAEKDRQEARAEQERAALQAAKDAELHRAAQAKEAEEKARAAAEKAERKAAKQQAARDAEAKAEAARAAADAKRRARRAAAVAAASVFASAAVFAGVKYAASVDYDLKNNVCTNGGLIVFQGYDDDGAPILNIKKYAPGFETKITLPNGETYTCFDPDFAKENGIEGGVIIKGSKESQTINVNAALNINDALRRAQENQH